MSFTSDCPKCRKQVLVPDGACAEARVRCPLCTAEYPLGEVMAAAPPALIVVGVAVAEAAEEAAIAAIAPVALPPSPADAVAAEAVISEPPAFQPDGSEPMFGEEEVTNAVAFAPSADDAFALATEDEFHAADESGTAAQPPAAEDDAWGVAWKEVGEEGPSEDQAVPLAAEEEQADDAVDFAAITGSGPPAVLAGAATGAGVAAAPPQPQKRRRKRQANPIRTVIGIMIAGALALPCADLMNIYVLKGKSFCIQKVSSFFSGLFGGSNAEPEKPTTASGQPDQATAQPTPATPTPAKTEDAKGELTIVKPNVPEQDGSSTLPNLDQYRSTEKTGNNPKVEPKTEEPSEKTEKPSGKTEKPAGKTEAKPAAKTDEDPLAVPELPGMEEKPGAEGKPDIDLPLEVPTAPVGKSDVEPKTEPKTEPKAEPGKTVDPKTEEKPAAKTEPKLDPDDPFATPPAEPKVEPEPKIEPKVEPQPEPKAEPAPTPEPKVEPKVEPTPEPKVEPEPKPEAKPAALGPIQPPAYELADLGKAFQAAHDAYGCLACNNKGMILKDGTETPCEVCKGKPSTDVSAEAYLKLCQLAEMTTFASPDADLAKLNEQRVTIQELVQQIGKAPQAAEKIAALAKTLLDDAGSKGGILLPGTVLKVDVSKEGYHGAAVKTAAAEKPVLLMSDKPLGVKDGDQVLILGSLIREPAKNLAGYSGSKPLVIWAGMSVKLP